METETKKIEKGKERATPIYIGEETKRQFKARCALQNTSMNKIINEWIEEYLESFKTPK